jgi:integrase
VFLPTLTIHHGRHTFISHALAGRRTLAEVRDAVGHANITVTLGTYTQSWMTILLGDYSIKLSMKATAHDASPLRSMLPIRP